MEIKEKLGEIVERAKQITKVSKEEWNALHKRTSAIEKGFGVVFGFDGESMMISDAKEKEDAYPFDVDEWLDEKPENKRLIKAQKAYAVSYWKTWSNIKKRCNLVNVEAQEMEVDFTLRWGLHLRNHSIPKTWKDLRIMHYDVVEKNEARNTKK